MPDIAETLGSSLIQHGKENDRIYLMELAGSDMPRLLTRLNELAVVRRYGKIFAKVPAGWRSAFETEGYATEAMVPGFYGGKEDGHFMAKYVDRRRAESQDLEKIQNILARVGAAGKAAGRSTPVRGYRVRCCMPQDCQEMAALFREIFPSYPFPVHDAGFLQKTMTGHVVYFGAWYEGRLAALASAERYPEAGHAEMTDFVTAESHRRQGLAGSLLAAMETAMREQGLAVVYTIARALSAGINRVFARADYSYGGTLINNTQICGRIESMNVWYKRL